MDPRSLEEHEFGARIHQVLFPATPIQSSEFLFGREAQLDRIRRSLMAPGRQIFIYGERGVGKSSLANAAAAEYQSSDAPPIHVSCSSDGTFNSVVWALIKATNAEPNGSVSVRTEGHVQAKFLGASRQHEETTPVSTQPLNIEEAAARLDSAFERYSKQSIAVIDEFDRIPDSKERNRFAELLKALGDRNSRVKLIFTGVASALNELLESHASAHRQLDTIELARLNFQPRIDIVKKALAAFDTDADMSVIYRIGNVSNGFPYYVHLMAEQLLWVWYEDRTADTIELKHLHNAFARAADVVHADLRRPYDQAARGRDHAAYVLWAVADAYDLERGNDAIWRSYQLICEALPTEPLERRKVTEQLRKLRDQSHASILAVDPARRLHRFNEAMVRGYVRMVAASQGIELDDQNFDVPPQIMHIPRASNRKRWFDTDKFLPPVGMGKARR
ncbi:ATP-binding protein [Rhodanobacter sp. A1T4]|uniref:AAA family ATPase n=1 Tax=Rhodanobacter sp. A1T4 TaxID=2723087 RepID=UPI00161B10A2|nr:ATP-binding protein [Rhodanobacter sp. A1T4]MBB6249150.1 energy-coupling factor transporter ATP-binding protein EcfA2 [Rhodanobacter sp. A1T4]